MKKSILFSILLASTVVIPAISFSVVSCSKDTNDFLKDKNSPYHLNDKDRAKEMQELIPQIKILQKNVSDVHIKNADFINDVDVEAPQKVNGKRGYYTILNLLKWQNGPKGEVKFRYTIAYVDTNNKDLIRYKNVDVLEKTVTGYIKDLSQASYYEYSRKGFLWTYQEADIYASKYESNSKYTEKVHEFQNKIFSVYKKLNDLDKPPIKKINEATEEIKKLFDQLKQQLTLSRSK